MECFLVTQVEKKKHFLLSYNFQVFVFDELGYIPQRKFQLGNRYRVESDACLTGTKASYEQGKNRESELRKIIAAYPKTQSVNNGTVVKHFLDYHRAYNPNEISQRSRNQSKLLRDYFFSSF